MNTEIKKKVLTIAGIALILLSVAVVGLYYGIEYTAQPPSTQGAYNFIVQNYNSTLTTKNLTSTSSITVDNNFTLNNQTYYFNDNTTTIYYLGADFCPYCAMEGFNIYAYLHNTTTFPAYNSQNYMIAEDGVPAIMPSLEWGIPNNNGIISGTANGVNIQGWEVPITTSQLQTENASLLKQAELNTISSMPPEAQYLFSLQGYRFPQVYVVKTIGNQTTICNAYGGVIFYQVNATDINTFKEIYNMNNVPLATVIPDMGSMNYNYNLIGQCVNSLS